MEKIKVEKGFKIKLPKEIIDQVCLECNDLTVWQLLNDGNILIRKK